MSAVAAALSGLYALWKPATMVALSFSAMILAILSFLNAVGAGDGWDRSARIGFGISAVVLCVLSFLLIDQGIAP